MFHIGLINYPKGSAGYTTVSESKMAFLFLSWLAVLVISAESQLEQNHKIVTRVSTVTVTHAKTVIPTCYEPTNNLNVCRRKRQMEYFEIPNEQTSGRAFPIAFQNINQRFPSQSNLDAILRQNQYPQQRFFVPQEIQPSFKQEIDPQDYPTGLIAPNSAQNYPAGFSNLFGGYIKTEHHTKVVHVTKYAEATQTLTLDCLWPGASLPHNLCKIHMDFPVPNNLYIGLDEYVKILADLGKVAVGSWEVILHDEVQYVRIYFVKSYIYGFHPNRRLILKNIIQSINVNECNVVSKQCHLPGLPDFVTIDLKAIVVPGIINISELITLLLRELFGSGCINCVYQWGHWGTIPPALAPAAPAAATVVAVKVADAPEVVPERPLNPVPVRPIKPAEKETPSA